ncbi:hypothetical protein [Filimonas effusa]|uniref:T9SS C-terminal target domain-containing protein n=1 Tax=Filimonas effusa TaxID=2508721 RepID=A0A4Q1D4H4_9BACT|nr:hypothetical protein [Filimonas effusa]RXK83335.1 hypothetical protein ESB13_14625 [Filimonas effusa]
MTSRINFLALAAICALLVATGCKKNTTETKDATPEFNRAGSSYLDSRAVPSLTATVPNVISSALTLTNDRVWLIDGPTFVVNNATLTIQPGTFIKGRKASTSGNPSFLLSAKGAKIIADGTIDAPIVFTTDQPVCSRGRGDWGGVVLLGSAPINVAPTVIIEGIAASYLPSSSFLSYPASIQYGSNGGANDASVNADAASASTLRNVRIEFAGDVLEADNELNGLTLGGVGSATILENIQVSYGADDAFEFFGGSVNAKNLIAYGCDDDDFDFDNGYQGAIQFAAGIKLPCAGGYSTNPNGIECNNNTNNALTEGNRPTHPVLSNLTLIGHSATPGPIGSGSAGVGALFRQTTEFTFVNSLVGGFATGVNYSAATVAPSLFAFDAVHGFTAATNPASGGTSVDRSTALITNDYLLLSNPFSITCACGAVATPDYRYNDDPFSPSPADGLFSLSGVSVTHPGGALTSFSSVGYAGAFGPASGPRWDVQNWTSYAPQTNPY